MSIDKFVDDVFLRVDKKFNSKDAKFARRSAIDSLSAMYAGLAQSKEALHVLRKNAGLDKENVNISELQCVALKSLAVGIISHSAELDDGVISGIIHPGSPILSALICHAPEHVDSRLFYEAITIGYEVCTLISESIQPNHKMLGYHATATCGIFGAIVALSIVNGHDKSFCIKALNVAANYSTGSLSALKGDSNLKAVNVGFATQIAISSYMLTVAGFNGPNDAFQGKFGFFDRVYSGEVDFEKPFESTDLAISRVYNKPFASCRYCHPAIDCILSILQHHRLEKENISKVDVETYGLAIENHDHVDIKNTVSAKMSIPYSVAATIIFNKAGLQQYETDSIKKVTESGLLSKIHIHENEKYSELFPDQEAAKVTITTNNGEIIQAKTMQPRGSMLNPMSEEEIKRKLIDCADFAGIKEANSILEMLWSSENINLKLLRDSISF